MIQCKREHQGISRLIVKGNPRVTAVQQAEQQCRVQQESSSKDIFWKKVYTITTYQEKIYISGGGFVYDLSSWVHRKLSMML